MNRNVAMNLWNNKEYFSKGKRGFIYLTKYKGENFIIKVKNPESKSDNVALREYENNLALNKCKVGPKVYFYEKEKDFVVREFVDGKPFFEWLKITKDKKKIKTFLINLLEQCKRMDDVGINKLEMNHPHKDLLVVNNLPVIIDFERCKKTIKPKNLTQLCQFFVSENLTFELKKHNIIFDKQKIITLAEKYKKEIINKNENKVFEEIKKEIKKSF